MVSAMKRLALYAGVTIETKVSVDTLSTALAHCLLSIRSVGLLRPGWYSGAEDGRFSNRERNSDRLAAEFLGLDEW